MLKSPTARNCPFTYCFLKARSNWEKITFISLAFLLLPKKKEFVYKIKTFSQNTDVLHFPEDFTDICKYQRTIDENDNLQIPKEERDPFKVNNKNTWTTSMTLL